MKNLFFAILLLSVAHINANAQTYLVNSPDGKIQYQISVGETITYMAMYKGSQVLFPSEFSLKFDQAPLFGNQIKVNEVTRNVINEKWTPVAGSFSVVSNHCNQLNIELQEILFPQRKIQFVVRVYDDGIAFRYIIPRSWKRFLTNYENSDHLILMDEKCVFNFHSDNTAWVPDYKEYDTHQEGEFIPQKLSEVGSDALIGLPLLIRVHEHLFAAVTEADLTDWAGMYLRVPDYANNTNLASLRTDLSPLHSGTGKVRVKPGSSSPWRVLMIADSPGKLIESQIIQNLNDPCAIEDPSWIKPGISAWDHWWSGEVQMDTETIKNYIQLAADMGWEYMLIDWHWYGPPFTTSGEWKANPNADITTVNPDVDMPEVIEFAEKRNVKLLLWLLWDHAERQMEEAFPLYEKWGIAGVKIDFMARDDQDMVNWYHKVVKKAAEHHLAVDFHGAYKPTGWSRTYPNLLTREGVLGNEYSKWSSRITPEHNVTLPFTRMLAGQMDYTPGAFLNVTAEEFRTGKPAMVMNTRAHQLAMFVVYFSPLTVACDHPDNYKNASGIAFLKEVPTVWDETRVLTGEVGKFIVMARKKGERWYVGAMNNSLSRGITIKLDFLEEGKHTLNFFRDKVNTGDYPASLETGEEVIKNGQYYYIKMAPGGGFAAWID